MTTNSNAVKMNLLRKRRTKRSNGNTLEFSPMNLNLVLHTSNLLLTIEQDGPGGTWEASFVMEVLVL